MPYSARSRERAGRGEPLSEFEVAVGGYFVTGTADYQEAASICGDNAPSNHLEAEIGSRHALAPTPSDTDWPRILLCHSELSRNRNLHNPLQAPP